ncbi:hypothetical protein AB0C04_05315 [Micromonospora sp. NPDC048909]|uniref:hypothetical protein n=1 Tax=Micromonospora sp. NPDC048909 TaxID=3155643 RepID=UPI00340200B1
MTDPSPPRDSAPATLAWLGHPFSVAALVLLVVNDQLLKAAFPGLVTGKLSDVAGLVIAPPLVAVLLTLLAPRLPARAAVGVGLGLVGVGFAVVKSSGYAAAGASAIWSVVSGPSLVRADRTDLLTLPALLVAAWSWSRARREPVGRRPARLVRLLVLLPAAMFAVAATSPVHYPDAVQATVADGRLVAGFGTGYDTYASFANTWRLSQDGGTTWRDPTGTEEEALRRRIMPAAEPVRQGCSAAVPARCYRLASGRIRVEQSDDAGRTWRLAWEVTKAQRAVLIQQYQQPGRGGERVAGQELTVQDTDDGRHVVLVANGRDGFALRRADGVWERIGFAGAVVRNHPFEGRPPTLGGSTPADRGTDPLRAVLLGLALIATVLTVSGARAGRRAGIGSWLPGSLVGLGVPAVALLVAIWLDASVVVTLAFVAFLPLLVGVPLLALIPAWARGAPAQWTVEVFLAAALAATLAVLPLGGWLYGRPAYTWAAVLLALLASVPGLLLGWRAARLVGRPTATAATNDPPYPPLSIMLTG